MNNDLHSPSPSALRMTRQRRLILEEFRTPGRHLTADDVYASVRAKLPHISLGTVYRNLEILSRAGRIRKLDLGGGQRQYDGGLHRHYHVRCIRCGRSCDVSAEAFGDLDAAANTVSEYEILGHELVFQGICSQCASQDEVGDAPNAG